MLSNNQNLQGTVALWIAANEAKDRRIQELEVLCAQLQSRIARLDRRARQDRPRHQAARS
jgi:hypothetical protein